MQTASLHIHLQDSQGEDLEICLIQELIYLYPQLRAVSS